MDEAAVAGAAGSPFSAQIAKELEMIDRRRLLASAVLTISTLAGWGTAPANAADRVVVVEDFTATW
jgi:hypothetical protein